MGRRIALIYNWWSLYTRLAIPTRRTEAIITRPLMLDGIGRQTKHSNQTRQLQQQASHHGDFVKKREVSETVRWHDLGPVWPHNDGKGLDVI